MPWNPVSGVWEVDDERFFFSGAMQISTQSGGFVGGEALAHFAMVKELRKQFKKYSKEEFRELSKEPVIKDILTGTTKLTKEEIAERIKDHLDNME